MHASRLVIAVPLVLALAGCNTAPEAHAPPAPGPAPQLVLSEDGTVPVDIILVEVRTQFEGTWEPFYTGKEPPGSPPHSPGLQAPLDIIRIAEQVAASSFRVDGQDILWDVELKIRDRFDELASATYAPYGLGEAYLTGGGGHWQTLPPPPPPPPDPLYAFRVDRLGTNEPFVRRYLPGTDANSDGPADGKAWYWILFRYRELRE